MSTTEHHERVASTGAPGNDRGDVFEIDAIKRRNRLDQLLFTRSHLATMAAQQRSHGMDDAQETFMAQCAIESTIREEYPQEFEDSYAHWLTTEVADEHPPGFLTSDCGICCSIAAYSGVNLVPPESA